MLLIVASLVINALDLKKRNLQQPFNDPYFPKKNMPPNVNGWRCLYVSCMFLSSHSLMKILINDNVVLSWIMLCAYSSGFVVFFLIASFLNKENKTIVKKDEGEES